MADFGYTTHTPRAGNRALAARHTEAGAAKRERIPFQYYRDEPPVFAEGDTVKVIDDESIHCGRVGHVSKHLGGTKYSVRFDWSKSAILPFHKSQLAKVAPKVKTPRKRKAKSTTVYTDTFACPLGVFDLTKDPQAPARWMAYRKSLDTGLAAFWRALPDMARVAAVAIEIPPSPITTPDNPIRPASDDVTRVTSGMANRHRIAHAQFVTFLERVNKEIPLDSARLTIATWHSIIEHRLEKRAS